MNFPYPEISHHRIRPGRAGWGCGMRENSTAHGRASATAYCDLRSHHICSFDLPDLVHTYWACCCSVRGVTTREGGGVAGVLYVCDAVPKRVRRAPFNKRTEGCPVIARSSTAKQTSAPATKHAYTMHILVSIPQHFGDSHQRQRTCTRLAYPEPRPFPINKHFPRHFGDSFARGQYASWMHPKHPSSL